jgi:hypothetical protein
VVRERARYLGHSLVYRTVLVGRWREKQLPLELDERRGFARRRIEK